MSHSHETVNKSVRFGWRTDMRTCVLYGSSLTHVGRSLIHVGRSLTHDGRSLTHVGRSLTHVGRLLTPVGRSITHVGRSSRFTTVGSRVALSSWCLSGMRHFPPTTSLRVII